jgi:Xaa-Pro aminopeptidase
LVFDYILNELKIGVTEIEVAKKIEIFMLLHGASISFAPIVAFGKNSSSPHHVASDRKLNKNEIVLLDFGVKLNGYCSDMTRTVFFGKANDEQKEIYQAVSDSQLSAINYFNHQSSIINLQSKIRIDASELDKVARQQIEVNDFLPFPHSLGHGIGLEVHEKPSLSPNSENELKDGMVFSIEPGIYLPDFGGVRIEDLFCVRNGKLEQLTRSSKKLIEL